MEGARYSSALPSPTLRPPPPGWWPVVTNVFVGYLLAAVILGLAGLAMLELGLINWRAGTVYPDGLLQGPFQPYSFWAFAANAAIAFTVLSVTAALVVRRLDERLGERPSFTITFLILALTGYVPFFAFTGRLRVSGIVGLLLAAALIRWLAVPGRAPADLLANARARVHLPARVFRNLRFLLAAAWAAAAGIVIGYELLHPIRSYRPDFAADAQRTIDGRPYEVRSAEPGHTYSAVIAIQNGGFADLRLTGVEAGPESTLPISSHDLSEVDGPAPGSTEASPAPPVVAGRSERLLTIILRAPGCNEARVTKLSEIRVRYRILGRSESAVLPLKPAIAFRCRS